MGEIVINGGVNIARIHVENGTCTKDYVNHVKNLKYSDDEWRDDTVMLANMNNSLAGNGADYSFKGIKGFKVYKNIGKDNPRLYKIFETSNLNERKIIDRLVGNKCSYRYYIYPICNVTDNDIECETVSQPICSEFSEIKTDSLLVLGLTNVNDNIYIVDTSNIWRFNLNLNDGGTSLNTNKTFSETQNQYNQLTGSFRGYATKSVTALLGNIDCTDTEYIDNFEKIEAWDNFCKSCTLKILIDTRGRIFVGDINNNPTTKYGNSLSIEATVSFDFIELENINNIVVLGETYIDTLSEFALHDIDTLYNVSENNIVPTMVDKDVDIF